MNMLRRLVRKVHNLWLVHVVRDRQTRAFRRWFSDRGDETLRLNHPLTESSVVIDAGGYKGDWAWEIHRRYRCSIHILEPVKAFSEEIERRFQGIAGVHVTASGLAGSTRHDWISLSDDASSALTDGDAMTGEQIHMIDALEFFDRHGISEVSLMKVNIEGGEFELLERLIDSGIIGRIERMQIQFHRFVPDAEQRRALIHKALEKTHKLEWDYFFVWESWVRK